MAKQVHLCPGCWKGDQLQKKKKKTVKEKKSEMWKEIQV